MCTPTLVGQLGDGELAKFSQLHSKKLIFKEQSCKQYKFVIKNLKKMEIRATFWFPSNLEEESLRNLWQVS